MNKSKSYILPLVLYDYQENVQQLLDNIENTFIRYREKDYVLVLTLYKDNLTPDFFNYYKELPIFVDFSERDDRYLLVLSIPEESKLDYDKFIDSKYSKISESGKEKIIKFTYRYYPLQLHDTISKVVFRDPQLIKEWKEYLNIIEFPEDVELSSKIDLIKETYNYG